MSNNERKVLRLAPPGEYATKNRKKNSRKETIQTTFEFILLYVIVLTFGIALEILDTTHELNMKVI